MCCVVACEGAARPLRGERRLLGHVQGGCDLPFGAWCEVLEGDRLSFHAALLLGNTMMTVHEDGDEPEELADRVWTLLSEGRRTR